MQPKKQYAVFTWGGFYNPENVSVHGITKDVQFSIFDTEKERSVFLDKLESAVNKTVAKGSNTCILVRQLWEGYNVNELPCCHRISKYKGIEFYSKYPFSFPMDMEYCKYHMEYKWYPSFNDNVIEDEFGTEVDYDKVEIVSEWVTGSFQITPSID